MTKYLLTLLLAFSVYFKSSAQIDTSFWFAAPDISTSLGEFPIVFHFQTYDQPTIISIVQPAANNLSAINATFSIPANSIYTLNVTPSLTQVEGGPANTVDSNGVYISSKEKVSVYYSIGNHQNTNKEMISLKGQRALGTDFYIPAPNTLVTSNVSSGGVGFDIVATQTGLPRYLLRQKPPVWAGLRTSPLQRCSPGGKLFR